MDEMQVYKSAGAVRMILCADCGTPIEPNSANLCISCLRNTVDITSEIPKQASLSFCRGCERYLNPPDAWTSAELESRELLAMCLKKLKGLSKVRLIDASFIWTEPHSRRIKVKLTVQKEVFTSTILQQIFEVEFLVLGSQCPECARLAAKNTWQATVQVRQKVPHKRTFFFLEQLILKHNAQKDTVSILEKRDGLDFFYAQRNHAIKMCSFLESVTPIRIKSSEQLLSTDTHSGTSSYKFTYSVELVPICKDDLVCIPPRVAKSLSNISPLTICSRVANSVHLLDPTTLQTADVASTVYWRSPFNSLATTAELVEFIVLDIEPSGPVKGKLVLADAQVALSSSFGSLESSETIYHARTHLGAILQPGDTALGYYLTHSNFNSTDFDSLNESRIPDVILVRKNYPNRRKKAKARQWKLKSIAKEAEDPATENAFGRGALGRRGGVDQQKVEKDYELFLRELEEDPEMRSAINLYKAPPPTTVESTPESIESNAVSVQDEMDATDDENEDESLPEIEMNELLDDLEALHVEESTRHGAMDEDEQP